MNVVLPKVPGTWNSLLLLLLLLLLELGFRELEESLELELDGLAMLGVLYEGGHTSWGFPPSGQIFTGPGRHISSSSNTQKATSGRLLRSGSSFPSSWEQDRRSCAQSALKTSVETMLNFFINFS
jgi:hypothetical protein